MLIMKENIELPEELVSVKAKLSFSIGGLANGLLNGLVFANLTFFYQIKLLKLKLRIDA